MGIDTSEKPRKKHHALQKEKNSFIVPQTAPIQVLWFEKDSDFRKKLTVNQRRPVYHRHPKRELAEQRASRQEIASVYENGFITLLWLFRFGFCFFVTFVG